MKDLRALWREPSTKRGTVLIVTGGMVLYQTLFGDGAVDMAAIQDRVIALLDRMDGWIGLGLTLAGLLGWLPDERAKPRDAGTVAGVVADAVATPANIGSVGDGRSADPDRDRPQPVLAADPRGVADAHFERLRRQVVDVPAPGDVAPGGAGDADRTIRGDVRDNAGWNG